MTAHIRIVVHVGLSVEDGYSDSTAREVELGLDQDGLFGWEMLWTISCKLLECDAR